MTFIYNSSSISVDSFRVCVKTFHTSGESYVCALASMPDLPYVTTASFCFNIERSQYTTLEIFFLFRSILPHMLNTHCTLASSTQLPLPSHSHVRMLIKFPHKFPSFVCSFPFSGTTCTGFKTNALFSREIFSAGNCSSEL